MVEAEEVRQLVSHLTKSTFQITTTSGRYPVQPENVKWFMWCPEITEMRKIPYLNVIWADKSNNIYLDSMPIGDTTDLVSQDYGEKAAQEVMDLDFTDYRKALSKVEEEFPIVGSRISEYEATVNDISTKRGLSIQIFHHGRKGRATLRLRGKVSPENSSTSPSLERIRQYVDALKEAWDRIELNAKRNLLE